MLPLNSRITGHGLHVSVGVSMLDACNAPAQQPHNWTWSARRLSCRQVIQYFNLSDFLLTHSGFPVLLFMGLSAECCLYVLHFSCENAYLAVVDFIFYLGCMLTCTTCWISFGQCYQCYSLGVCAI